MLASLEVNASSDQEQEFLARVSVTNGIVTYFDPIDRTTPKWRIGGVRGSDSCRPGVCSSNGFSNGGFDDRARRHCGGSRDGCCMRGGPRTHQSIGLSIGRGCRHLT